MGSVSDIGKGGRQRGFTLGGQCLTMMLRVLSRSKGQQEKPPEDDPALGLDPDHAWVRANAHT